jgi:hypothetical protein
MPYRSEIVTANPQAGDYILREMGFTWTIERSHGNAATTFIETSDTSAVVGLARVCKLAESDESMAWQETGERRFRLIRNRGRVAVGGHQQRRSDEHEGSRRRPALQISR